MRIAILDDYTDTAIPAANWSDTGEITVFHDTLTDRAALIERLRPFEVICAMRERTPLPAELIAALPNLKLIVTSGMRNKAIDLEAARACGITVCGTELGKTNTSELTMALILAANRRLLPEAESLRAGGWQVALGRELAGLTLGLVGLGRIGAQMAGLGRAFGMEIAAWSQNLTEARCAELGVQQCASLTELMGCADVVSVHLLLSERTTGLIGADAFAAMRPGAVFVNTSRGPIVDNAALLKGLRAGQIQVAALDVFDTEPLPKDHPLRDEPLIAEGRLLLTPHLGYATEQNFRLAYGQMVEAIQAWKAGNPVRALT